MDGETLAVAAPYERLGDISYAGAVYVFRLSGGVWKPDGKLRSPEPSGDAFGSAIDVSGDRVIVGAPASSGRVFVFRRRTMVWNLAYEITPPIVPAWYHFGRSVAAIEGGWIVGGLEGPGSTGALFVVDDPPAPSGPGAVIRSPHGDDWSFASTIAVSSGRILVNSGWPTKNPRAYLFAEAAGAWAVEDSFSSPIVGSDEWFWSSLALTPRAAIVGAPRLSDDIPFRGAAFITALPLRDCNNNQASDLCDIRDGRSEDCNASGAPDECEQLKPFDSDFDGDLDLFDLSAMQRCFSGSGINHAPCCAVFDVGEKDGDADLDDYAASFSAISGP